jgi:hypothetical protein
MAKKYDTASVVAAVKAGAITSDNLVSLFTAGELSGDLATLAMKTLEGIKGRKALSLKVSAKKCVQLDGLRRFPVSLYKDEWNLVLDFADDIRAFIAAHESELKGKYA